MPLPDLTYDTRCYDLAEVFLEGVEGATPADAHRLAVEIQQTIEDFIVELNQKDKTP